MTEIIYDSAGNLFKIEWEYDLGLNLVITSINPI